jgi:DNA polymerase-3 subunit delta'
LGDEQSHLLGHLARGKIGWAIAASEDRGILADRDQVLRKLTEPGAWRYASRFAWAEQLSRKPAQVGTVLDVLASWWRDVLLVASGSVAQITNVDRASMLRRWADRHGTVAAQKALSDILDTAWRLEHNANLRLALEVLMLELPAGF